jgi:hypothetical protein
MGILCDYFAASSDEQAASVIDRDGGPRQGDPAFPTVDAKGIVPMVMMGTLEALLTGRTYDEVTAAHPVAEPVAVRDEGERLVVRLAGTLSGALADASDERLAEVAVPWSETEEFWGAGDPAELTPVLRDLAALARRARSDGQHLYCWMCV